MDEIVKAALAKWPKVPHCHGWLALDARGDWYMRDERIQAAGPFPQIKGSRILHEKLREFIHRNYEPDAQGAWYFQNGPQRVYVQLELAPWVWRLQAPAMTADSTGTPITPEVHSHTGLPTTVNASHLDEHGRLFLATPLGLGVVHTQDMLAAADAIEAGVWAPDEQPFASLPTRYGYVLQPMPG